MEPEEFFDAAEHLLQRSSPAMVRSAVGRAYYGLFHVASEVLDELGQARKRSDSAHQVVYEMLNNAGDRGLKKVASELTRLRALRNRADYDLGNTREVEDQRQVERLLSGALHQAQQLRVFVESEENRNSAAESITRWRALTGR